MHTDTITLAALLHSFTLTPHKHFHAVNGLPEGEGEGTPVAILTVEKSRESTLGNHGGRDHPPVTINSLTDPRRLLLSVFNAPRDAPRCSERRVALATRSQSRKSRGTLGNHDVSVTQIAAADPGRSL